MAENPTRIANVVFGPFCGPSSINFSSFESDDLICLWNEHNSENNLTIQIWFGRDWTQFFNKKIERLI